MLDVADDAYYQSWMGSPHFNRLADRITITKSTPGKGLIENYNGGFRLLRSLKLTAGANRDAHRPEEVRTHTIESKADVRISVPMRL